MHQGFTKRPEDEGRIVKGERNVSKIRKKKENHPSLPSFRGNEGSNGEICLSLVERLLLSPGTKSKKMTSDRWNTREWNNRGKGGSESMRGLRTAQISLSLSRSFSRILRALDFKEREMRRWVKKGSGIEKETMSSARRRILESISLPLADPLPAREENSGLWTRDINAFRSPDESRERCWCLKKKCVHFEEYFYDIRCQEKCGDPSLIEF